MSYPFLYLKNPPKRCPRSIANSKSRITTDASIGFAIKCNGWTSNSWRSYPSLTEYEVADRLKYNEKEGFFEQIDGSTEILSE